MHAVRPALALIASVMVFGTGCASGGGPVAGFDGSWTIAKRGFVASQPEALTRAAVREATAHCAARSQRYRQIDLKESPSGLLAPQAESTLTFACD